ncbi:hypothetical protein HYV43_00735 [Candidatus Micrarchaeota archaeon]|nr:hypothetical protein [Candidatus Micrarchaeota archaeon]
MGIIAALVSNRPKEASEAVEGYAANEDQQPSEWFIVTPKRHAQAMKAAQDAVDATLLIEEDVRKELPPRLQAPFAASFGGFRNMALAKAASSAKAVVFVDDDTRPENGVFRRHSGFLEESALVIGKYDGHVGGASSTLLDLTHALENTKDGKLGRDEFVEILRMRLEGIPPVQRPVENAGAVGGNLGIHDKTARVQPFVTLPYRVEDGTYAALCAGPIANPTAKRAPIVRHEKRGKHDGLRQELAEDWAGNALAAYLVAGQRGEKPGWEGIVAQVRKGLLLDYFSEKYAKAGMSDAKLDCIRDIRMTVSAIQADAAVAEYENVQHVWTESWETLG